MRHGYAHRKLGRTSSHRNAMFRNQLASLIASERIITTLPKAKEIRPLFEKLITLAKNDSVHARRQAAKQVPDEGLIAKLFDTIGPRFSTRPGGYTRIMKLGARRGDAAEMAILELVERTPDAGETKPAAPAKGKKKPAAAEVAHAAEVKPKKAKAPKAAKADEAAGDEKPKKPRKKKEE